MNDTIRYQGKTYGEADMAALLQALGAASCYPLVTAGSAESMASVWCGLDRRHGYATTTWAALCTVVRAAGLDDKPQGAADAPR